MRRRAVAYDRVRNAVAGIEKANGNKQSAVDKAKQGRQAAERANVQAQLAVDAAKRASAAAKNGGAVAKAKHAAAEVAAGKAWKAAEQSAYSYKDLQANVATANLKLREAQRDRRDAALQVYRNGFDINLDRLLDDLSKLDKALFAKRQNALEAKRKAARDAAARAARDRRRKRRARKQLERQAIRDPPTPPKSKQKIVYEGVDNSIAQQIARKKALADVQEDIEDNAINGSISERHLIEGLRVHKVAKEARQAFFDHQDQLYEKHLIHPKHRFID